MIIQIVEYHPTTASEAREPDPSSRLFHFSNGRAIRQKKLYNNEATNIVQVRNSYQSPPGEISSPQRDADNGRGNSSRKHRNSHRGRETRFELISFYDSRQKLDGNYRANSLS